MDGKNFDLIKDIKPLMNNICIQCLIIKYIEDPPDHINNLIKYHYHVADISGSIILCIPHVFIEEELEKNNINILNDDFEDILDGYNNMSVNMNELANNKINEIKYNTYNINNKKRNNVKTLKYLFKVGDILNIYGAVTTWSMGKMVIMPNTTRIRKNGENDIKTSIHRVGFFNMTVNIEPNISNLITSTTEKKYKMEDNNTNNNCKNNDINKDIDNNNNIVMSNFMSINKKMSKYDIMLPNLDDDI
ncbi:conserved Plasmodium protein, unknown function [Plasmodium sp. gorilla clade G2]|uniref:conserved Plasmodium protein, unknown function n=1 Tax=Plasmodium sp. gorilla clade G2 TaxID=880535 RepID=UPI000D22A6A1|nr:conserved Plasmodium protein, unknown function [Plasmodium sp. gorilla clade G2]SOV17111.1 conserved Plasmodium protein, unknown function [Plasmodium sp. gorilla clade G2]